MLFVHNPSANPYFNIASEEYLLRHFDVDIMMIWSSLPSVIVGKHQNTLAEINLEYINRNNIPVVRRLSGGGTVFHDPGNINFTFIRKSPSEKLVDFKLHTQPIIDFLQSLGVDAQRGGKNDIRVSGLKISGNAEHVHKTRVLHHGTLLFDSNLTHLEEAIKAQEDKFESKAVKSNRSVVTNISDLLKNSLSREQFIELLKDFLCGYFNLNDYYTFDDSDIRQIEKISEEKYKTWEWNFGYSPSYTLRNKGRVNGHLVETVITVHRGKITHVVYNSDDEYATESHSLQVLSGVSHKPDVMAPLLEKINFMGFRNASDPWEILRLFF